MSEGVRVGESVWVWSSDGVVMNAERRHGITPNMRDGVVSAPKYFSSLSTVAVCFNERRAGPATNCVGVHIFRRESLQMTVVPDLC